MSKYFSGLIISFFPIFVTNIIWITSTAILIIIHGLQFILQGRNFFQSIATSQSLKWILLIDAIWVILFLIYLFSRRNYRSRIERYFLQYEPITNPKICVVMPAFNEEDTIQKVVNDFCTHKYVKDVIVIDNHSSDKTVELARQCGATVITKLENRGYAHSVVMGLKEALKTEDNLIAVTESDGSYSAHDLDKMLSYIEHCDVVNGSRQVQFLNEMGNCRGGRHVWGNYFLAKLIQLKYLNLPHLGVVNITDQGCMFRIFRRDALAKIENELNYPGTDIPIGGVSFTVFLTMKSLEKDFRIIEVPVTYKKRVGSSKTGADILHHNLKNILNVLWIICKY